MWVAINLTQSETIDLHHLLRNATIEERPSTYPVVLRWSSSATATPHYDLVELICHTKRAVAPEGALRLSPITLTHMVEEGTIHITQDRPQMLKDYVYALRHPSKHEKYHSYESYNGTMEDLQVWTVYPEVLRRPVDLTEYIEALSRNNALAQLIRNDVSDPRVSVELYVIYVQEADTEAYQYLEQLGLGVITILPELDIADVAELSDDLLGVGINNLSRFESEKLQYPYHPAAVKVSLSTEVFSSIAASTNATLVTPKGQWRRGRRAPGAPRKIHLRQSNDGVDPLEDERWQLNVSHNLTLQFDELVDR